MKAELRIALIEKMLGLLDQKTSHMDESGTLEVAHYLSQQHLEAELNTLFKDFPILVAHSSQLKEAGSFITMDVGHTPLLINRDRHGVLHAFLNSCRHRGARVVTEACGQARAFRT